MQFTPAEVGAGMTERWYGFLMQFTPAKLVPAKLVPVKAGSREQGAVAGMTDDWSFD